MEPIKILIADDDRDFCSCIGDMIALHPAMELVGLCYDGKEACCKIEELEPDLILLDNCMPILDGIGVIEWLATTAYHPYIFTMSAWDLTQMIPVTIQQKITYAMQKPIEWAVLAQRILQLVEKERQKEQVERDRICRLLTEFEILPQTEIHLWLQEALWFLSSQKELLKNMTGLLYPKLSKQFNISSKTIERKIQYEIEKIFTSKNSLRIQEARLKTDAAKGKLTNKQFLVLLASELGYL